MYYYTQDNLLFASLVPNLPLPSVEAPSPEHTPIFLFQRPPETSQASFCVTDARQLTALQEDVSWLDPSRMSASPPAIPRRIQRLIDARLLRAINISNPRWLEIATLPTPHPGRFRVHILAVGSVGSTLLTGLKLMGRDCIDTIGICDLNGAAVERWTAEMGQVSWPWNYSALPEVEPVAPENLYDCDVILFTAAKGIPPIGQEGQDVRMAQYTANRKIVEYYARQARHRHFRGLFIVISDPVDLLCKAAYLASNRAEDGQWDGMGLTPGQIHGYGIGVMNARAAYFAKQDSRFHSFLEEGRTFGPHGRGLVIANSIAHYDDTLSRELTDKVLGANLRIRALGYKPYVAPALSSGAMQLLLTLRGQWHYGSVCLGGVWFGIRNRYTPAGLEVEVQNLPDALFARLQEAESILASFL